MYYLIIVLIFFGILILLDVIVKVHNSKSHIISTKAKLIRLDNSSKYNSCYFATFRLDNNKSKKFNISYSEYLSLKLNDIKTLTYKEYDYISFK